MLVKTLVSPFEDIPFVLFYVWVVSFLLLLVVGKRRFLSKHVLVSFLLSLHVGLL